MVKIFTVAVGTMKEDVFPYGLGGRYCMSHVGIVHHTCYLTTPMG